MLRRDLLRALLAAPLVFLGLKRPAGGNPPSEPLRVRGGFWFGDKLMGVESTPFESQLYGEWRRAAELTPAERARVRRIYKESEAIFGPDFPS